MDSQPTNPVQPPEPEAAGGPAPAAPPATASAAAFFARRPRDYWALWAVAVLSLALNAVFLYEHWAVLAWARAQAPAVAAAASEVQAWRASALEYTVHVDRTLPVITNVPINQVVRVPISATLPVDTEVQIPLSLAGFTQIVRLPVKADIPVQLETEVPINLTVPIHADVPVQFDVPIRLPVAGTPLDATLSRAEAALTQLSAQLQAAGLVQFWQQLGAGTP